MPNMFYPGDNLCGLELLYKKGVRVDLVYIDPPFATRNEFLVGSDRANSISASGKLAYSDTTVGAAYLDNLRARLR